MFGKNEYEIVIRPSQIVDGVVLRVHDAIQHDISGEVFEIIHVDEWNIEFLYHGSKQPYFSPHDTFTKVGCIPSGNIEKQPKFEYIKL
jgi:hypothetical protein